MPVLTTLRELPGGMFDKGNERKGTSFWIVEECTLDILDLAFTVGAKDSSSSSRCNSLRRASKLFSK